MKSSYKVKLPPTKSHKTVFLVEDDEDDQFLFTEALSEIKNTVLFGIANNGKEALERLANATILPDIIFTDINMPIMNGIECLTQVKRNPITECIPVVILSSVSQHTEMAASLGVQSFIVKPSCSQLLRIRIEQAINLVFLPNQQTSVSIRYAHSTA